MGVVSTFPGGKARSGVTLTTYNHPVPRLRISRSCAPLPLSDCMALAGQL
jgi:hypothetical protein